MIEIKVGEFLRRHISKLIDLCSSEEELFLNLQDSVYCNNTFGLNSRYSLIKNLEEIEKRGIFNRYYKENHTINGAIYRVCSQFGGSHLIEAKIASVYHGEKLLAFFKLHQILLDEYMDEEIVFIVSTTNNTLSSDKISSTILNQILFGPPGTGKTYNTINKALEIIDAKVPEERAEAKKRFEVLRDSGQIEFVTFHQSYGYEEFVEGIKASTLDGEISYDVESGVFKKLCKLAFNKNYKITAQEILEKAKKDIKHLYFTTTRGIVDVSLKNNGSFEFSNHHNMTEENVIKALNIFLNSNNVDEISSESLLGIGANGHRYTRYLFTKKLYELYGVDSKNNKNYIIIIDEINRGNISKIFGELITLIEPSKRIGADEEIQVRLPYSNELFGVPKNLYIIGTMNTADRSIALLDTALRRRFDFVEMMPKTELLDFEIENIHLGTVLETINARVEYLYDREHTIGHSYFMELDVKSTLDDLNATMKNKIIPLLQEYFYDDWKKILLVLNDGFIEESREDALKIFESIDDEYLEEDKMRYSVKSYFDIDAYERLCQIR